MLSVRKLLTHTVVVIVLFGYVISQADLDREALASETNVKGKKVLKKRIRRTDLDLWVAAENRKLDEVNKALAGGANPNWRNPNDASGWTALHVAAFSNHPGVVSVLLKAGAKKNLQDTNHGWTSLHWAAIMNNPVVVKVLLNAGADKDVCGGDGITPIFAASLEGSTDTVKELITHGADFNLPNCAGWYNAMTPLMIASSDGHLNIVKALLEVHAKVHLSLPIGYTALHGAAGADRQDIVQLLLQYGSDTSKLSEGMTPSDFARKKGFDQLANFIDKYAVSNNPTVHDTPWFDMLYPYAGGIACLFNVAAFFFLVPRL